MQLAREDTKMLLKRKYKNTIAKGKEKISWVGNVQKATEKDGYTKLLRRNAKWNWEGNI